MTTINREEILNLLAAGKVNAAEAAELLNSAAETEMPEKEEVLKAELEMEPVIKAVEPLDAPDSLKQDSGSQSRWFRVRVKNLDTGRNKVSVNIPLPMVKFGLKIGRQFSPELNELNLDEMLSTLNNVENGMIVDVQDEESNEHVQIFIN